MAREMRRPLPAGRYWADIFPQNRIAFDAWVNVAGAAGAIHGEVSEHFDARDGAPEHDFVIFTTNRELVWPDADMGFAPNVAGPDVHSSEDTVQKPPPTPSAADQLSAGLESVGKAVVLGVAAVAAVAALVLLMQARRRK